MSRFRILKEIKKSLKRKRRHVWSLGAGVGFFLLATLAGTWLAHRIITNNQSGMFAQIDTVPVWVDNLDVKDEPAKTEREQVIRSLKEWGGQVELVLHRTYLCGEETRKLGRHTAAEAEELLKSHWEWQVKFNPSGQVLIEEAVDDLSPECRKTAYFGMDKDGNLSLYEGPPWREKVLRTFFQLDVNMLETRMPLERVHELTTGIRVADKDEYNSVLSTFNDFARLKSQASRQ
ncbi:BofC C-terminal domain-containing protein [Cohnella abietis]|uniref:Bypass of forespore C C-terminal domain-containing protein n=1 Tax=Cohnella abietis TaxID=2507935 RepID=A0A3T1D3D3_9BACL|nr:BofC C-terminal domain-containing protein [Cohnella abietis]BBI32551.1 hypothetical protein KCTCHS21_19500 [Cohnella abietis]